MVLFYYLNMLDIIFLIFGATLLIDIHSLNAFFDIFTPVYAIAIIALIIYLRANPAEESSVAK